MINLTVNTGDPIIDFMSSPTGWLLFAGLCLLIYLMFRNR